MYAVIQLPRDPRSRGEDATAGRGPEHGRQQAIIFCSWRDIDDRYHFAGGPKTHGQSDRHRAPGSVGAGTTPGRVLKGKRMPGHMGNKQVTVSNLEVFEADPARNLLLVRGAVPGGRNGLLLIIKSAGGK